VIAGIQAHSPQLRRAIALMAGKVGGIWDNTQHHEYTEWRTNLLEYSEGEDGTYSALQNAIEAVSSIAGFDYSIHVNGSGGGLTRLAGKTPPIALTVGNTYNFSFYIEMDDGGVPVAGTTTGSGDFAYVVNNALQTGVTVTHTPTAAAPNLYRVDKAYVYSGTQALVGVYKYPGQSSRTYKFTGMQITAGAGLQDYQKSTSIGNDHRARYPLEPFFSGYDNTPALLNVGGGVVMHADISRGRTLGADQRAAGVIAAIGVSPGGSSYNSATGAFAINRTDSLNYDYLSFTGLTPNKWHRISIKDLGAVAVNLRSGLGGGSVYVTTAGSYAGFDNGYYVLSDGSGRISITPSGGSASGVIAGIWPEEGLHFNNGASAQRGTLRGTPKGTAIYADDFTDGDTVGWAGVNASLSVVSGKMQIQNTAGASGRAGASFATVPGRVYHVRATVTLGTSTSFAFRIGTTAGGTDLYNSGTVASSAGVGAYFTATTTTTHIAAVIGTATLGHTILVDDVTVHDVSADAVTSPYYISLDGVDDTIFQTLGSFDLSSSDEVHVFTNAKKFSDAITAALFELSNNVSANNWSFAAFSTNVAGTASIAFAARGTNIAQATYNNAAVAAPAVLVGRYHADISADVTEIHLDRVQVATSAGDLGTGNFGASYAFYRGSRGASSLRFSGLLGGMILVLGPLTAAEIEVFDDYNEISARGLYV
jgi:hypothetical protein